MAEQDRKGEAVCRLKVRYYVEKSAQGETYNIILIAAC